MADQGGGLALDPPLGGPGFEVVEKALATINRYRMLEGGESVVVALSGGPDSICLLDVLARLHSKLELELIVAHVDHRLSEASSEIATQVSRDAAAAGFEVHLARAPDLEGPNLHERARAFRYEFLDIVKQKEEADAIATGHTLDDRAETTVARLIHGAGTEGLAGIPPAGEGRIRPLIEIRRPETRAYCEVRGLRFYDDPSNADLRFERPAVRATVINAIEQRWGDGGVRSIARSSERLREDADALSTLADRLYRDAVRAEGDGVSFPLDVLMGLPRAFRRRLLEKAVGRIRDRSGGIEAALDSLDTLESGDQGGRPARFAVAGGTEIVIEKERLSVQRDGAIG
jgi:tRNA(Ile)-lysidine synthase